MFLNDRSFAGLQDDKVWARLGCLNLTKGFEEGDSGGGGEVEASLTFRLGDSNGTFLVLMDERFGEAVGFAAEDEAIAVCKTCIPDSGGGF